VDSLSNKNPIATAQKQPTITAMTRSNETAPFACFAGESDDDDGGKRRSHGIVGLEQVANQAGEHHPDGESGQGMADYDVQGGATKSAG
jgi:hypothetical protein